MTVITDFVNELRQAEVQLWIQDGKLRYRPVDALDAERLAVLRERRDEVISELRAFATAPDTVALEAKLAELYRRLLRRDEVGATDSFFDLGGHSMLLFRLIEECTSDLGLRPTVQDVFDAPSVRELAALLAAPEDTLQCLAENAGAPLLVFVHTANGSVQPLVDVARRLGDQFAVYALPAVPEDPPAEIAARYVDAVDAVRGVAPVAVAGWSTGGYVAVEMARRWLRRDERVAATLLLDSGASPSLRSAARDCRPEFYPAEEREHAADPAAAISAAIARRMRYAEI